MSGRSFGPDDRERLDFAERLYEEARSRPAAERQELISRACVGDDGLREQLDRLLRNAEAAENFFERLAGHLPSMAELAGTVIGRYEILACIGVGGMGAVYRARDTRLQRDVALKFLPPVIAATPEAQQVLLREARAAASLEHPNICTVHEIAATDEDLPFISMAFYEGETLKDRLLRDPIPIMEAVEIVKQLARGLAAAHARGIVHRDVKPSNVMLVRDGPVKLLDFGLARSVEAAITRPGITPGTVAYMSPEQARGDAIGPHSDLFSLGILLYEMVAGVRPFRGGTQDAVIRAILEDQPAPLRSRRPAVPAGVEWIVTRLLRKDAALRYANASELLADLEALSSRSASILSPLAFVRSKRARVVGGSVIAMIVIGAIGASLASQRSTDESARRPLPAATAPTGAAGAQKTIAVLPFANLGRDSTEDYLVDGLTEELISALSHVRSLRVVARTSAFAFKSTRRDIREVGRMLGASAIVEGSVQRVGGHIRVRAQLISVADGFHLWSEAYDREVTDIFAVQQDLALRIARAMQANLSPAEQARVRARRDVSPEAFALYLKGRHFWNQRTSSAFVLARDYYQRAIDADSQFAAAYAGLATVYSIQGIWGDLPSAVARERVKSAATRAVQLDDSLAEAHSALGVYEHAYAWNVSAAEREQLRAIELDPKLATARYFYGNLLRVHGRLEEALVQYRTAAELDPLAPLTGDQPGVTLILAGRLDEAERYFLGAIELDSMFWWPHGGLGLLYEAKGQLEASLHEFRRARELGGPATVVARLLARTGREQEARQMLGELQTRAVRTGIHPPEVATILHALGDTDGAMVWLEQAFAERHPALRFISGNPGFAPLQSDPRYLELLRRIGLRR